MDSLRAYEQYTERDKSRVDIQILYSVLNSDGQFFCVHYYHLQEKVTIYASSWDKDMCQQALTDLLEELYPFVFSNLYGQIDYVILGDILPNEVPSGLAAIIVATALLFEHDPKDLIPRLSSSEDSALHLWRHLQQIFVQRKITQFPTVLRNPPPSKRNPITSRRNPITSRRNPITSKRNPITSKRKLATLKRNPIIKPSSFAKKFWKALKKHVLRAA